eukprot:TRINITY_DN34576_c0_g1_i1.p1 TRINITY_DN34576_c0_g1~~TRINITY_DN34576_c0_g1_i1.p1  ORF type:complete len:204 (+),score=24.02 TRINITY_DN34576_c0_g1_i1:43-654(+)
MSEISFKLQLVGNSGVGKSCILLRFTEGQYTDDLGPTIGVDFRVKNMTVKGQNVKLMVWDTAGQERFRTLTSAYYRGAHGVILVYDITDEESFEKLDSWMEEIDNYKSFPDVVKLLVGNKTDLEASRKVSASRAEEFARKHSMMWIEVSAKTKEGIAQAFRELVNKIFDTDSLMAHATSSKKTGVNLSNKKPEGSSQGGGLCC